MTLHFHLHTAILVFFLLVVFWRMRKLFGQIHRLLTGDNLRLRAGVGVSKILQTPVPIPTPVKTVDFDRLRLQSRLRLRSPGYNGGNG